MHSFNLKTSLVFAGMVLCLAGSPGVLFAASENEMQVLEMFYDQNDLVTTPSRSPKSISQVAENITIVTADEIGSMNAHTLTDVLNTVTGVQLTNNTGPGNNASALIQASESRHVLVLIDGVTLNNLSDSFPDVGAMRVQHIERIEIVKGPASSSWGSSLGGIINIITKSPDDSRYFGGTVSAAVGERGTGDYRLELSGTKGPVGYYLSGGGLRSDGLMENFAFSSGNLYSKISLQPDTDTSLTFTIAYDTGAREAGAFPFFGDTFEVHSRHDYFYSTLALNRKLTENLNLELAFRTSYRNIILSTKQVSIGLEDDYAKGRELTFGGNARLLYARGRNNLVVGSDFDFGSLDSPNIAATHQRLDKWALYANDTIRIGRFSLTPGLRYDHTNTNGDFWSPSLGVTCAIGESTVLRGVGARGFSIPPLGTTFGTSILSVPNPDLKMEKVWSYSLGFETAALRYLWVKATYFRHNVTDALVSVLLPSGQFTVINSGKQTREGVEVEIKTTPIYHVSLSGGYTYINIKDRSTGETVKDLPRESFDIGIHYDDSRYLKASLRGRYLDYNASPDNFGSYGAIVWDLNLSREFRLSDGTALEAFFTAHNLFNGSQYLQDVYRNPRRWFEGGLRFSF